MRSDVALRLAMQALVLLDLLFVQLTEAVALHWLAPLYALTLAAPRLAHLRENKLYRAAWNLLVIAFSAVLVQHAASANLAYVLEDGLVLAVLCQVHLLNNLRQSQRPDLLFFNAFLIATITGFMTHALGFALAFLAFAPCFVVGQQLLAATRDGHVLSSAATRRLVTDGSRRAGLLLGLSVLAFLFWPRDFDRKPLFTGTFELVTGGEALQIGFSEELDLKRQGRTRESSAPALRVTLLEGSPADVPSLWRGATLGATDGSAWTEFVPGRLTRLRPTDERWEGRRDRLQKSGADAPDAARVHVERLDASTESLFTPLSTRALRLDPDHRHGRLRPRADGTVDFSQTGEVSYELVLAPHAAPGLGGALPSEPSPSLVPYLELPEEGEARTEIAFARRLAADLAARMSPGFEQYELVARVREHLSASFVYVAPGAKGGARSLEEFLSGKAGGHCEFFASALATLLRSEGVPCRVVTGYRSTRWDAAGEVLSFDESDAHAWVEVFDPEAGWYAVDASPTRVAVAASDSLWERLQSSLAGAWATLTEFDTERRAALYAQARALPSRAWRVVRAHPLRSAATAALFGIVLLLALRRRRARTRPAIRSYRRAVGRSGLRPLHGETPRELLARARGLALPQERLERLEVATRAHEERRYAA